MSSLTTITAQFYDRKNARVANLKVKSRYKGSQRENIDTTDNEGKFVFQASLNKEIEILAKPPNETDYSVVKTTNSSVSQITIKLPKSIEEYNQKTTGIVHTLFKIVDSQGKIMPNFPVKSRPKGKASFERKSDENGIVDVQSSANRDIELLVLNTRDEFELKSSINSGRGTTEPIVIRLNEPYNNYKSTTIVYLLDKDKNTYVVAETKVSMIVVGTREKKVFTTSTGKLPINSMVGEKVQFVVYKPNGQPLSSTDYVAARIKEGPVKIHLSVDATKGTTGQNKPLINRPINTNSCGLEFRGKVRCTRYKSTGKTYIYGPLYKGEKIFANYDKWDELISSGKLDSNDRIVLMGVAPNEGNFDAVQSYDSEIITAGAMQKTINSFGTGELPEQIYKFKENNMELYKSLFENCGWVITKSGSAPAKASYNNLSNSSLKALIRKDCNQNAFGQTIVCSPVESMIAAISHPKYIDMQVVDFIDRLNVFLNKIPIKHKAVNRKEKSVNYAYKIKEYIKSNLGKATILDHSINRPGHVTKYFGEALNHFFSTNKEVSENPSNWGANHLRYENEILEYYGSHRGNMTQATLRFNKTKKIILELEKKRG